MKRSSVVSFCLGVVTGWLIVAVAAGSWILYTKSVMDERWKQQEKEFIELELTRIKLPVPPLETGDYGLFDYSWAPNDLDGNQVRFADMADRFILINVWGTGCKPCIREMPELEALADWIDEENHPIDLYLVAEEKEEDVKLFLEKLPLTPPVISCYKELPACLWSKGIPLTVIVRPGGQICYKHLGAGTWSAPEVKAFLVDLMTESDLEGQPDTGTS